MDKEGAENSGAEGADDSDTEGADALDVKGPDNLNIDLEIDIRRDWVDTINNFSLHILFILETIFEETNFSDYDITYILHIFPKVCAYQN